MKKTILHLIDSLGRGGSELMLVNLLEDLSNIYEVILVTLNENSDFSTSQLICYKRYCLNYQSPKDLPFAVLKLRKIIKRHKPTLVRTDLYWSTIIGRLACPKKIPFVFAIHSPLGSDAFLKNRASLFLEKWTYNKRQAIIGVSKFVLDDYRKYIDIKGKYFVLNNYVDQKFFDQHYNFQKQLSGKIKLVAVGNLKEAKNYEFLLNAIGTIKDEADISLDIIGEGPLKDRLMKIVNKENLPVNFVGKKENIYELLPSYTAFIMCSHYEGFGNSAVEAMAVGLPLILNDKNIMREMSKGNALFFESDNCISLGNLVTNLKNKEEELSALSEKGKFIARKNYTKEKYVTGLLSIYDGIAATSDLRPQASTV